MHNIKQITATQTRKVKIKLDGHTNTIEHDEIYVEYEYGDYIIKITEWHHSANRNQILLKQSNEKMELVGYAVDKRYAKYLDYDNDCFAEDILMPIFGYNMDFDFYRQVYEPNDVVVWMLNKVDTTNIESLLYYIISDINDNYNRSNFYA